MRVNHDKRKKYIFFVMLVLSILVLILRFVDLRLFTDTETGYAAQGSVLMRYIPLLILVGANYILSGFVSARPHGLLHRCTPLGLAMILTGTVLMAMGLADIAPLTARGATVPQYLDCLLPVLTAFWFWRFSARAFSGATGRGAALPSAVSGIIPTACFAWLLIDRFALNPASLMRIGSTFGVLGAVTALLFVPPMLRIFMTPGSTDGHALFATGMNVFMIGTCCEVLQAGFELRHSLSTVPEFLETLAIACVGVCGLICAWYTVGPDMAQTDGKTVHKAPPKNKGGKII